jgi:outer membrane biosynthesis protein TonB
VSSPRLRRALAASAAVHLAVLGGLLALAHPRFRPAPAMRVALVGHSGPGPSPGGGTRPGLPGPLPPLAVAPGTTPPRPSPARPSTRPRSEVLPEDGVRPGEAGEPGAEALVTAVQSDVWVLAGSSPPARGSARSSPPQPPDPTSGRATAGAGSTPAPSIGTTAAGTAISGGPAPGEGNVTAAGGAAAPGGGSLLAALSQRLAWSAARCAPAEVVRTARRAIPGVPLHFCLDTAGRPSDVGLLGTTGSEVLDRAARDCVVPGALPLPPVPGCYTVEVRFPRRG